MIKNIWILLAYSRAFVHTVTCNESAHLVCTYTESYGLYSPTCFLIILFLAWSTNSSRATERPPVEQICSTGGRPSRWSTVDFGSIRNQPCPTKTAIVRYLSIPPVSAVHCPLSTPWCILLHCTPSRNTTCPIPFVHSSLYQRTPS